MSYLQFMPYATKPLCTYTNQMQDMQLDSKYLVSDVKFIHIEVAVTFYRLDCHWASVTKQNQKSNVPYPFHMEHSGTWSYYTRSPASHYIYIYTRSLSEGSRDIPSLNLAITYPSRAQQKGFDLPRCISCSCAILCSVKNFNSFQMLAHRVLTQLLYNYSIIQQYYEKDQKHRRILQHLEALADKNKKIWCCL